MEDNDILQESMLFKKPIKEQIIRPEQEGTPFGDLKLSSYNLIDTKQQDTLLKATKIYCDFLAEIGLFSDSFKKDEIVGDKVESVEVKGYDCTNSEGNPIDGVVFRIHFSGRNEPALCGFTADTYNEIVRPDIYGSAWKLRCINKALDKANSEADKIMLELGEKLELVDKLGRMKKECGNQ